jgi:hypothetical protein
MKIVKFKIVKPSIQSGYYAGYIGEASELNMETIKKYNEIEIISETEEVKEEVKAVEPVKASVKKRPANKK